MNPFYGVTKATLVQYLADAREELAAGSSLIGTAAGETKAELQLGKNLSAERRIELLWRELNHIDPDNYPADAMARVRVTAAQFNDLC